MAGGQGTWILPNYTSTGGAGGGGGTGLTGTPRLTEVDSAIATPGLSISFVSDPVTASTTGTLVAVHVASTTAFEAEIRYSQDAIHTTVGWLRSSLGGTERFELPNAAFVIVNGNLGASFDGFVCVYTNCDANLTAEVGVTFFWTEV